MVEFCCLNRPFDNQSQDRIHLEAEAILSILSRCQDGIWSIAASDVIELDLSKVNNIEKSEKVRALYSLAGSNNRFTVTEQVRERAITFQKHGIKLFDSLHLTLAEINRSDVLLTTDDGFLSAANKFGPDTTVANPVNWLMEVVRHGQHDSGSS